MNHAPLPPVCSVPQVSTSTLPPSTLCSDCRERMYEDFACKLDPTYDRAAMNTWERLEIACKGMTFPLPLNGNNPKAFRRADVSH